jgi:hypothetical protein
MVNAGMRRPIGSNTPVVGGAVGRLRSFLRLRRSLGLRLMRLLCPWLMRLYLLLLWRWLVRLLLRGPRLLMLLSGLRSTLFVTFLLVLSVGKRADAEQQNQDCCAGCAAVFHLLKPRKPQRRETRSCSGWPQ